MGHYVRDGRIYTAEVRGQHHNLGSVYLVGPVMVLRILLRLQRKGKPVTTVTMWVDNMEVFRDCRREAS